MYCRGNAVKTVVPVLRDENLISGKFICNYKLYILLCDYLYFFPFFFIYLPFLFPFL